MARSKSDKAFDERVAQYSEELRELLTDLYGEQADEAFRNLTELMAKAHDARPADLKRLDTKRLADPEWYKRGNMFGMTMYTDLFAGDLKKLADKVPYLKEQKLTYLHLKTTRRLHVWTPAGYEKSVEKLPVLYLIHGGGDTDLAWPTVGCAGNILDNLLAENKMQPMIVVMPNGSIATENLMDEVPLFAKDLMNDIIPYIEANYRVLTDKDHRALAGLSMGGMETLEAGLNHYKEFGYLWVLSSGWFETNKKMYAERSTYLKTIAQDFNHTVHALHFTQGGPEDIAYNNCKAMLKLFDAAGINYKYSEAPGGHTWYTWRNDLYNLAQQLFKY